MTRLVWLPSAERDLHRLHAFLCGENPQAALSALKIIKEITAALPSFPHMGIALPQAPSYRELFIPFGKRGYRVRYRQASVDTLVIVRVWHSREIKHD